MNIKVFAKACERRLKRFVPFRNHRKLLERILELQAGIRNNTYHTWQTNDAIRSYLPQILKEEKYQDPKRLEKYGYKVYSQNDEDGIIAEIFRRIGEENRFFVEFGVQDGLECNSHCLLLQGWHGAFIEGSSKYCEQIRKNFSIAIQQNRLTLVNAFITAENINALLTKTRASEINEIDLLSIDIDGNDYHVFKVIDVINPRVIIIEFNVKFPPPMQWIMPYNVTHVWDGSDNCGASLESMTLLANKKGYRLVATNINGVNAFFVRQDLCKDLFVDDHSAMNLYNAHNVFVPRRGHVNTRYLGNVALD